MKFDFKHNHFVNVTELNHNPFVIGTDRILTDAEVYDLYLKLRKTIHDLNIPAGHPVCIYGEKQAAFPVAMVALLSLNIPYVPIDAMMPKGRIEKIKEQTQSRVIINCSENSSGVEFDIVITKDFDIEKNGGSSVYSVIGNHEDPVRYILFTSGSTGTPKGVQITKTALNSFVNWYLSWDGIDERAVFMNQAPFSFDVSLCDFIGGFANGSKVIYNSYDILKNANAFLNRIKEFKANTIVCTPSFIKMYLSIPDFNHEQLKALRQIIFMGEELPVSMVKKLMQAFPNIKIVNAYGPTEATVVVTYIDLTLDVLVKHPKSLPIGYCRPNAEVVILDKDPETGIGELGIVGQNLSVGYLNDQEKTNQSYMHINGKRVYKTGDTGYIEDNLIFYLGRNDNQVKLNGYRIELEEISNLLLTHSGVLNVAVIPLTANGVAKKIIAFVILSDEFKHKNFNEILKQFLLINMPAYMVPSEFIAVANFPLNANYKTDKKALLEAYMTQN